MILVTGATGNIGSELVKHLTAMGKPLRVVSRDKHKVAHLDKRIERLIGDMSDETFAERAVAGVSK